MSNVVIVPDGAIARQRRTVAIDNPTEGSHSSDWQLVTDLSRPTEDAAFKRIGVMQYMVAFINGGCEFGSLEWSLIIKERRYMKTPFYTSAVVQIATDFKAPVTTIADMLNNISLKMTVREFLGLDPLPIAPLRIQKQLDKAEKYNWRDARKVA